MSVPPVGAVASDIHAAAVGRVVRVVAGVRRVRVAPVVRVARTTAVMSILVVAIGCSSNSSSGTATTTGATSTGATAVAGTTRSTDPAGTVAGTTPNTPAPSVTATMTSEREVSGAYRQGLARFGDGWVFSTNLALYRTDDAITEGVKNEAAIPPDWLARGYNHIGDIDIVDGIIYAPVEQPDYDRARQAMFRFDAATLRFLDAVEVNQHHNSFVSVDPSSHVAYSTDQFHDDALVRYDVDHGWAPLAPIRLSQKIGHIQGGDLADGAFWLSTDDERDGLYRIDIATGQAEEIGSLGHIDGEGEGVDATALPTGLLHAISVDAKLLPVYLEHFAVASAPG